MYNDKMIENIITKLENLSSSIKNQLSFNKMIETQIAQIAAALPVLIRERFQGNPKLLSNLIKWSQRGSISLYVGKTTIIS